MPLHVRAATAFRWRLITREAQREDLVRICQDGEVQLALLANGYDSGFSTCCPPASRLILDVFEEAWAESSGSVGNRLAFAFDQARQRFNARGPALVPRDDDFPDEFPTAVLLAVATVEDVAHAAWVGGDIAVLARGFVAASETTPHTLREQWKREHPAELACVDQVPNILVRTIGPRAPDQDPPAVAAFRLEAGDVVVLLSKANFRAPCFPTNDVAFAAAAYSSPAILAERLVDLGFANGDSPYSAAAVLRFDSTDVETEIDRLVDRYEPDPSHGAWLGDWARARRALPVSFDVGGALGIRRDGTVLSVAWDRQDDSTREETSGVAHLAATVGAARTKPTLETLAPRRPAAARACPQCGALAPAGGTGCPTCWYLGWEVPKPPAWFRSGSEGQSTRRNDERKGRLPWWRRIFGTRA